MGYSPWDCKESDTTENTLTHSLTQTWFEAASLLCSCLCSLPAGNRSFSPLGCPGLAAGCSVGPACVSHLRSAPCPKTEAGTTQSLLPLRREHPAWLTEGAC